MIRLITNSLRKISNRNDTNDEHEVTASGSGGTLAKPRSG